MTLSLGTLSQRERGTWGALAAAVTVKAAPP
jgi:hypothetical protein